MDPNSAARSDNVDRIENIAPACKSKMVCNNDFVQLIIIMFECSKSIHFLVFFLCTCTKISSKLYQGREICNQFELHEYIFLHTFIAVYLSCKFSSSRPTCH